MTAGSPRMSSLCAQERNERDAISNFADRASVWRTPASATLLPQPQLPKLTWWGGAKVDDAG